jgi:cadmium resistance protein CadD (predicted permease)
VQELIVIAGLAAATFVSTSIDNLLLLVGFFTSPGFRARGVVLGYVGSVIAVLGVGFAASYAADFAPNRYAGYLGLVPILMGVTQLYKAVRGGDMPEGLSHPAVQGAGPVGLVMLANSGDSLGAFVALFAETREPFTFVIVGLVAALSLAWIGLARWVAGHTALQQLLQRWGRYLLPLVLIAVGAYILADTRTDTLEVGAQRNVEEVGRLRHR